MFKLSKYNILIENLEDSYLIYNTRSGAFCSIEKEYKKDIDNLLENPSNTQNNFFKEFFNAGFIVKKDLDETNDVYNLYKYYTNNKDSNKFYITIIPYEGCNFDCPYCFVYKKRNKKMKLSDYENILKFIKINISDKTDFNLCFFGGEPTLQKDQILNFLINLNSIINICNSKNISMITNGYLLTKENFIDYLSYGINEYQITLDGFKNAHDTTRYLKNKKGTFDRIWNNLINIKNIEKNIDFKIVIRSNFLKTNIESCYELLDNFLRNFGDDYRFGIYFKPVYEFSQSSNK